MFDELWMVIGRVLPANDMVFGEQDSLGGTTYGPSHGVPGSDSEQMGET
jgi:hypothetical protein